MPDDLLSPLNDWHLGRKARMVPFAGMLLPVQYHGGIKSEHLATRENCGLFDISHMVQMHLTSSQGMPALYAALAAVFPIDFLHFDAGSSRYSFLLNDNGGVLDDVIVSNGGDRVVIVANGARRDHDPEFLRQHLPDHVTLTVLEDHAFLALQGPKAAEVMARFIPDALTLRFMQTSTLRWHGVSVQVFRQGYTGEDGFEISLPTRQARDFAEACCAHTPTIPVGLGARDSLRLEAGLPLWGQELDEKTTPLEANLGFAIARARRASNTFPGSSALCLQYTIPPEKSLVGLQLRGKQPARAGATLYRNDHPIGLITSGGVSPSLGMPIALGYVRRDSCAPGNEIVAEVRGKMLSATLCPLPFVPHRYHRNP